MTAGRPAIIDQHPRRNEILSALYAGDEGDASIGRRFGVDRLAVMRYRRRIQQEPVTRTRTPPAAPTASPPPPPPPPPEFIPPARPAEPGLNPGANRSAPTTAENIRLTQASVEAARAEMERARQAGRAETVLRASRSMQQGLELLQRLITAQAAETPPPESIPLHDHPDWTRVRESIATVAERYPEAGIALAEVLTEVVA